MYELRENVIRTYRIEGRYPKTSIGRLVWIVWNGLWEAHGWSGW